MKTYKNLYDKCVSNKNITEAVTNLLNNKYGKKLTDEIIHMYTHIKEYRAKLRADILHFSNDKHKKVQIHDGISKKKRIIVMPTMKEQVVHHMLIQTLEPIILTGYYEHSYGSIPGRGPHKGKKHIKKEIQRHPKKVKYCLKMDIRHFFNSIPHDKLNAMFRENIQDERLLELMGTIVEAEEEGLPLGFYTSHWFANWYLKKFDHFVKEELEAPLYYRYMDDMVIFAPNKKKLHKIRKRISEYLENELGLELKKNWQVFRFDYIDKKTGKHKGRPLDFMGFKFYRGGKVILRKSIMIKITRKSNKLSKKEKLTLSDARSILSYLGWVYNTNTYNMYIKNIKFKVNVRGCKKLVSNHDKKMKRLQKQAKKTLVKEGRYVA